jgi:hypothetical protein
MPAIIDPTTGQPMDSGDNKCERCGRLFIAGDMSSPPIKLTVPKYSYDGKAMEMTTLTVHLCIGCFTKWVLFAFPTQNKAFGMLGWYVSDEATPKKLEFAMAATMIGSLVETRVMDYLLALELDAAVDAKELGKQMGDTIGESLAEVMAELKKSDEKRAKGKEDA